VAAAYDMTDRDNFCMLLVPAGGSRYDKHIKIRIRFSQWCHPFNVCERALQALLIRIICQNLED
jgi:hypothetical protein